MRDGLDASKGKSLMLGEARKEVGSKVVYYVVVEFAGDVGYRKIKTSQILSITLFLSLSLSL